MRSNYTTLQILNDRWRGIMPFRRFHDTGLKHLISKRRTGEPSPVIFGFECNDGYGKSRGSYTEKMRKTLYAWMQQKGYATLTFDYRLHRHKTITVVVQFPYIKHLPSYGRGKKGFVLQATVLSIDGVPYRYFTHRVLFAWDRIIAREQFLALTGRNNELSMES